MLKSPIVLSIKGPRDGFRPSLESCHFIIGVIFAEVALCRGNRIDLSLDVIAGIGVALPAYTDVLFRLLRVFRASVYGSLTEANHCVLLVR